MKLVLTVLRQWWLSGTSCSDPNFPSWDMQGKEHHCIVCKYVALMAFCNNSTISFEPIVTVLVYHNICFCHVMEAETEDSAG